MAQFLHLSVKAQVNSVIVLKLYLFFPLVASPVWNFPNIPVLKHSLISGVLHVYSVFIIQKLDFCVRGASVTYGEGERWPSTVGGVPRFL